MLTARRDLRWVAGILDLTLQIDTRLRSHPGTECPEPRIAEISVTARVPRYIADEIARIWAGLWFNERWHLQAQQQSNKLGHLSSLLLSTDLKQQIRGVISFRRTQPRHGIGAKMTPAVQQFQLEQARKHGLLR